MRLVLGAILALLSTFTLRARADTLPDVMRRVAPKVVRIQYDEASVGSGFVYPDDRHVTTAYTVVNRDGEPEVVLRTGAVLKVKVVAWSETDDLAILELPVSSGQYALELEPSAPYAGQDVVLLGYPHSSKESKEERQRRPIPTPRFGKVSVLSGTQVAVDVDAWPGDDGAPLLTETGRVLGVLSGNVEKRLGVVDAALPSRIVTVSRNLGKQGELEPHAPASQKFFGGFYVSPVQPYRMIGAGLMTGLAYGHWAVTLADTISQGSYVPTSSSESRAVSQLVVDLYGTWGFNYTKARKLSFGLGASWAVTWQDNKLNGVDVQNDLAKVGASRIDPLLVVQDVEGSMILGVSWMPTRSAARLDLGVVFNRL